LAFQGQKPILFILQVGHLSLQFTKKAGDDKCPFFNYKDLIIENKPRVSCIMQLSYQSHKII
jgi:hypothetical protein